MMEVTAAIKTLEGEREKLSLAIDALRHLNSFADANTDGTQPKQAKRKVSASTRAKMKAAQQARWRKAKLKIVPAKKGA